MKNIKIKEFYLGGKKTDIPVFQVGSNKGKKIVITAGADGDEYASIDAAYKLIEKYDTAKINGLLTIIPILNIYGFQKIQSKNPRDNKYPKRIYPGKLDGSASEKLIYWLRNNYIKGSDVWLDMHGGAKTETLDPYIYSYETCENEINIQTNKILPYLNVNKLVSISPGEWDKVEKLAKDGVVYFLTESGFSTNRDLFSINKHIDWAETIMSTQGLINKRLVKYRKKRLIYKNLFDYKSNNEGLWFPKITINNLIHKNDVLGQIYSYDGKLLEEIISNHAGSVLWFTHGMPVKKNETIIEVGFN